MCRLVTLVTLGCVAQGLLPSTSIVPPRAAKVMVAAEADVVPIVAAGGVAVLAIGAAVMAGNRGGKSKAAAPAPKAPVVRAAEPVSSTAAVAVPGELVKACWSGDAFRSYEWPKDTTPTVEAWRAACDAQGTMSYWDFGVRVIDWTPPSTKTIADWRAACEAGGSVISYYDFGLRLA